MTSPTGEPGGDPEPEAVPEAELEAGPEAELEAGPVSRDALAAAAVGLFTLAAYSLNLLDDVGFWDTAVFQGAPTVLGLTHPTGYPTYLILGWAWVHLLPMLQPAFALNLLTAITGAVGVSLVFLLARRIGAGMLAAAAGALTIAFMLSVWRTASRADPHPLHVLLALAIVLLLLAWDRRGDARPLVAAAVLFGLAMGNHLLTAMLAPGVGVYVITRRPSILRSPRVVLAAVIGLAAGLAVYLYVPIRAAADPPIHHDWAPTTGPLFLRYVLGQDFSGSMGFLTPEGIGTAARELGTFARQLGESLTVPVALGLGFLVFVGLYELLRTRAWRTAWLLLATGGLTLYARLTYVNADLERYALYPLAVAGALAALGATALWNGLVAGPRTEAAAPRPRHALVALVPAVLLLVPAFVFATNVGRFGIASARCYVDAVAADAEPGAYVVSWWSFATPLWYLQGVEEARPDVTVRLLGSGVAAEVARLRPEGRPIYLIQFQGELDAVAQAGFATEDVSFCGVGAKLVTGP